jgi:sigma-E factor negative regulatory protein RseA
MNARDTGAETLSALLDDEAQELELRRLLRDLDQQPELLERWRRDQLTRAALHGTPVYDAPDFLAAVQAGLGAAPEGAAPGGRGAAAAGMGAGAVRRAAGGVAIAASVMFAVLLGGQQLASVNDGAARVTSLPVGVVNTRGAVPVQASFGTGALPALQPVDRTAYRELARQRLRRYSLEHAEHAALNTPAGMLSFARVPEIEGE